ncbi:MAG: hypothetical protein CFH26_00676 [Alphaproteobacteria bacterium MarineAlpha6_Bin4]|nr:MAG: hypothetical protein CFH26_00676 [Alphaproteobacteria bacterium MarineAlpha6_Bin4]
MHNIAYIVCSNGFGHLKRSIRISKFLIKKNINIDFFYPKKKYFKYTKKKQKNFNIINFDTGINVNNLKKKKLNELKWVRRLPSMKKYDLIISDNLVDVLELNLKTILVGNFLWFKSLSSLDSNWKNYQRSLLKKFKPRIICCKYFIPSYFSKNLKKIKVGLFQEFKKKNSSKSLLIYTGTSVSLQKLFKNLLNKKIFDDLPFKKIYLDKNIYSRKYSKKFILFNYSNKHFSDLSICFGRPSMGIIHDCLSYNVPIISFYEKDNKEMFENIKNLSKINMGLNPNNIKNAIKLIKEYSKKKNFSCFNKKCNNLEWNGDKLAADKIIEIIKKNEI